MKPIIKVENLSKQYSIGGKQEPYSTFRETLVNFTQIPLKILKRFDGRNGDNRFWALKDINFEVLPGEVVGIIGRNGAGKSTLLKVLSRITEPTEGRVELFGRVGSLLEVGTGFHPELTGRENIFLNGAILGMRREEITAKFDEIVDFAEVENFLDTPVKRYSSGMYTRLAFSVAAHLETEILAVDEVLAVGDDKFQNKCFGKMGDVARSGRTVLFVSHNMASISNICSKAILLEKGQIRYSGSINKAIEIYLREGKTWEAHFENEAVTYAAVQQLGDVIEISVKFEVDTPLTLPNLGFCITNHLGSPVCGTNPKIDNAQRLDTPVKKGEAKVFVSQPKLLNGAYKLSIWFGNGVDDYFSKKDILTFDVVNMSEKHHDKSSVLGNAYPECSWEFSALS